MGESNFPYKVIMGKCKVFHTMEDQPLRFGRQIEDSSDFDVIEHPEKEGYQLVSEDGSITADGQYKLSVINKALHLVDPASDDAIKIEFDFRMNAIRMRNVVLGTSPKCLASSWELDYPLQKRAYGMAPTSCPARQNYEWSKAFIYDKNTGYMKLSSLVSVEFGISPNLEKTK